MIKLCSHSNTLQHLTYIYDAYDVMSFVEMFKEMNQISPLHGWEVTRLLNIAVGVDHPIG